MGKSHWQIWGQDSKIAFSKAKILTHFPWSPSNLIRGSSVLWNTFLWQWCILILVITRLHIRQRRAHVLYFSYFSWISYAHLNVGQTSENPVDRMPQSPAKPRWASPNPILTPDCDRWIKPPRPMTVVGSYLWGWFAIRENLVMRHDWLAAVLVLSIRLKFGGGKEELERTTRLAGPTLPSAVSCNDTPCLW
jgi:hypothetical protein